MAKLEHSAVLRIGGSVSGSFRSAVGSVSTATQRLQSNVATLKSSQRGVAGSLREAETTAKRFGLAGSEAVTTLDAKHRGLQRAVRAVNAELVKAEEKAARFGAEGSEGLERLRRESARLTRQEHEVGEQLRAARREAEMLGVEGSADVARLRREHERLGSVLAREKRQLADLRASTSGLGGAVRSSSAGLLSLGTITGGVATAAAGAALVLGGAAVAGVGSFAKSALDATADLQRMETALVTLTGSEDKARESMNWIEKFTDSTPYKLEEVGKAFTRLRAYGIDPTDGTLRTLGDTAAGMGKNIMDAVEAMADAVAGETERLKEFGIRSATSGDNLTFFYRNAAQQEEQRTVKKNSPEAIRKALTDILNPKYGGGMEKASRTWDGLMSRMESKWRMFQVKIMHSGPFEKLTEKLNGMLDTVERWEKDGSLERWARQIGTAFNMTFTAIERGVGWLIDHWDGIKRVVESIWDLSKSVMPMLQLAQAFKDTATWSLSASKGTKALASDVVKTSASSLGILEPLTNAGPEGTKWLENATDLTERLAQGLGWAGENLTALIPGAGALRALSTVSLSAGADALAKSAREHTQRGETDRNIANAAKSAERTVFQDNRVYHVKVDAAQADAAEVARKVKAELQRDMQRERMASRG